MNTLRTSLAGLLLSVAGALLAQFWLDSLADTSALWHELQHGMLFASGILAGASLLALRVKAGEIPT